MTGYLPGSYVGTRIYTSPLMTKVMEMQVAKSFRERWFPNPITEPFEPWISTKSTMVNVPSRDIIQTDQGLFMHPALAQELQLKVSPERSML